MYGHVFLYTVVVPDTYWFMQEYTVWPYDALNQGDGADKLLSIWSPNVPRDPLPLLQYLPGISCSWFGWGSCTVSLLRFHLHHAHVTKINTEINADVTLGRCQENGNGSRSVEVQQELVKFAILSEVCLLTAEIALQRLSFFLSFFYWRTELPEEAAFDCREFKKSSAAHLKGIRPDVQLLKKQRCDPWCKCRPWPQCSTSGHWKFV